MSIHDSVLLWRELGEGFYICRALICPEPDGGYSAYVLQLPGVVSQGETDEEVAANIREAFAGAIGTYLASGENIPWHNDASDRPPGAVERHYLVRVAA